MTEIRYWHNANGTAHRVAEYEESDYDRFKFLVRTACGLEYHTQTAGFTYDASVPAFERVHSLDAAEQCGNCPWPDPDQEGDA